MVEVGHVASLRCHWHLFLIDFSVPCQQFTPASKNTLDKLATAPAMLKYFTSF